MSVGEAALLVGMLINAAAIIFAGVNCQRALHKVAEDIHRVELETNSMKDALVKSTGEAAHAAGVEEGRSEGKRSS